MKEAPEEFRLWFKEQMGKRGWGVREAARNSKLSAPTISEIYSFNKRPSFETCKALASAFDVSVETVARLAGHLPPLNTPLHNDEWLSLIDGLPPEAVREMIDVAQVLRRQKLNNKKK